VIHVAAIRGGGGASSGEFQEVNVNGTERLLRAAYERNVQKFIFCSSVGVHGTIPVTVPAAIETALHGDSQYHQSKIASEAAVQDFIRKGLNAYIVRPTITYGPGDDGFPKASFVWSRRTCCGFPGAIIRFISSMCRRSPKYFSSWYSMTRIDAFLSSAM